MPIVGYRKVWLRIAKLGDLPADITSHVLRHSFASLAADLGYNERPSPACSATRRTASPAGTCIPPMPCCWDQPMLRRMPP
jgi:integrase